MVSWKVFQNFRTLDRGETWQNLKKAILIEILFSLHNLENVVISLYDNLLL